MKNRGTFYVLISAIFFSIGGVLIKLIPWGSLAINGMRSIIAIVVLAIYLVATKHKFVWNKSVLFGGLMNMFTGLTFVVAAKLTTAANAIVLQFTAPIFIILFLWWFFHTKPQRDEIITCIVAFAGIICFFFDQLNADGMVGNFFAILSGICYAMVFLTKKMPNVDLESSLLVSFVLGGIIGAPFIFQEHNFSLPVIAALAALGIVQFGLAYILLYTGLKTVNPVSASLISMIEPILNPIIVAVVCKEMIGPTAFVGAILVIGASTVYNLKH